MATTRALAAVALALAVGLAPATAAKPSEWTADNVIVADGPHAGKPWSADETPYVPAIIDCLAVDSPHNQVWVRKSSQVGMSEAAICWILSTVEIDPAASMYIMPTIDAVKDLNGDKISPTIEATPVLASRIIETKSRSGKSSTARTKRYPGGSLILTGANSATDLRAKTAKYQVRDEIDQWPVDLDQQGDPMRMADARQIAFHATGDYKAFNLSTPRVKGSSRIDNGFEAGDQSYWQVPCPHCGEFQRLEFGGKDTPYGLKFNKQWPYDAKYQCRHCGTLIEPHFKRVMIQSGDFVAENPGPGRDPSFHVDALISLLTTWDKMAEAFIEAKDDPNLLKTFYNLWLGLAWEERGDAPEWQRLMARREDFKPGVIPPGGIVLTGAADVQKDGIYYEVAAWGAGRRKWSIDVGFLVGDTSAETNPVWEKLGEIFEQRQYPDSYGGTVGLDVYGVDAGYASNVIYNWCRGRNRAMALRGVAGWHKAPIVKAPSRVDVTRGGKRFRRGARLWEVGTYGLKSEIYGALHKQGIAEGAPENPPGYIHLTRVDELHGEQYLKQLTAERINRRERNGLVIAEWVQTRPDNHFLDCAVYNLALAHHMRIGIMSEADWGKWVAARGGGQMPVQGDMLAVMDGAPAGLGAKEETPSPVAKPKPKPATSDGIRVSNGFVSPAKARNWLRKS